VLYQELKAQTNFSVTFQNLPNGIYFIEVKQNDRTEIKKIVKY